MKSRAKTSRSTPSPFLKLINSPERAVQIWIADLDSVPSNEIAELTALLDGAERNRAARFHFERDRQHYLAAHGLLRQLLGSSLDRSASELIFEYGPNGKPAIAEIDNRGRRLRFNLSHSSGWAMFALTWEGEVGIDLEAISHLKSNNDELFGLAGRILSPREMTNWRSLSNPQTRRTAFLRAWMRKEAYAKAIGKGVAVELRHIELVLDAAAPKTSLLVNLSPQGKARALEWAIHDLPAPEGFAAALAFNQDAESCVAKSATDR